MDSPEQPDSPPPTHWNTRRYPVKSFLCPFCGSRIVLKKLIGGEEVLGPGYEYVACCDVCPIGMLHDDWQHYKAMELLQEE